MAHFEPTPKPCPYCDKPTPCMNEMCNSHYMYGDENTPQLGTQDCKHYFQPLDFEDK